MSYFFYFILLFSFAVIPAAGRADSFSAFSVNPTSIKSGGVAAVSWTLDSTGHSLIIYCQPGVKIKKTDGAAIACNQKTAANAGASGSFGFVVANVSGSTQNVTIRVNAKNPDGTENDSVYQEGVISVTTMAQPVLSFTTGSSTAISGSSVTYTWSAPDLDGVNFMFECKSGIAVSSVSYTQAQTIPCNTPVFSSALPASGSQSFTFVNSNVSSSQLKVSLLPMMANGMYDATNASVINQEVALEIKKIPAITSFLPSKPAVFSGEQFKLSWNGEHISGVNLKFNCDAALMSVIVIDSSGVASKMPCFAYAFAEALPASSSVVVAATNTASIDLDLPIQIVPQLADNTYDILKSMIIRLNVLRPHAQGITVAQIEAKTALAPLSAISDKFVPGQRISASANLKVRSLPIISSALLKTQSMGEAGVIIGGPKAASGYIWWQVQWNNAITGWSAEDYMARAGETQVNVVSTNSANNATKPVVDTSQRFVFTLSLKRGARGTAVSELQKILKQDSVIYPDGAVSGYYGVLTEKAVGRFQEKYGIAKPGEEGYGAMGPKTRAKLNSLKNL